MDAETRKAFADLTGLVKGMDEKFEKRFDSVDIRFEGIDKRLEGIDVRFEGIDKRLEDIDKHLEGTDKRLEDINNRFDGIDKRFDTMDETMENGFAAVAEDIADIRQTMATKDHVIALGAQINSIEIQLHTYPRMQVRIADLEEKVFGGVKE